LVYLHVAWFVGWIALNRGLLGIAPFDPFPFGLLTMIVSLEAIFLATFVLLSQNRQALQTDQRARIDWAIFMRYLLLSVYPEAAVLVLVMDNLNTHSIASLYEAFDPATALALAARLEIHYTPKHGSWLNMAETELSVLSRQCLDRRLESKAFLTQEVDTWAKERNQAFTKIDWRFTTADARVKLKRLYPSYQV
jgi:hypothetical protein